MNDSDMMFIVLGFILALAGFGIYAMQVFQAYLREKKKIEEDFELSKKYDPGRAKDKILLFIMIGSTGIVFVMLLTVILSISEGYGSLPNSANLVARFIMIMGATVLVVDLSRISYVVKAARELTYQIALPEYIDSEKDFQKRREMETEYYEKNGFEDPNRNFGKYIVFNSLPETMLIYALLMNMLLLTFTNLLGGFGTGVQDINPEFASRIFAAGVLYVLLTIPAIFSMKKSAEMEMTQENFGKKIMVAVYGLIPSIMGLVIMILAMLPLLGE